MRHRNASVPQLSLASGSSSTICATATTGGVLCAGFNGVGECGDGTFVGPDSNFYHLSPSSVVAPDASPGALADVVQVASAAQANCALTKAGEVYCWGIGAVGQLGNGTNSAKEGYPVRVANLPQ
jgi:alpha-tubulin suppressor-like RCC1 family protein